MSNQIKKPSGQDGFDTATFVTDDISISPETFARYLQWNHLDKDEIRNARNPENTFPIDALPDVMKYAVLESVEFNQCPIPIAVAVAMGDQPAALPVGRVHGKILTQWFIDSTAGTKAFGC